MYYVVYTRKIKIQFEIFWIFLATILKKKVNYIIYIGSIIRLPHKIK